MGHEKENKMILPRVIFTNLQYLVLYTITK